MKLHRFLFAVTAVLAVKLVLAMRRDPGDVVSFLVATIACFVVASLVFVWHRNEDGDREGMILGLFLFLFKRWLLLGLLVASVLAVVQVWG
jgi:hypothetical protein